MPLRTKNQPLAGMAGGRVVSCGLSGESKRALSFCCYRYGAEIIRQTLLCRLGACREMPPTVPAGVDLCREILPGVPGPKAWHREELLSGLRESLLCRQIPPGVPKSPWIRREKAAKCACGMLGLGTHGGFTRRRKAGSGTAPGISRPGRTAPGTGRRISRRARAHSGTASRVSRHGFTALGTPVGFSRRARASSGTTPGISRHNSEMEMPSATFMSPRPNKSAHSSDEK